MARYEALEEEHDALCDRVGIYDQARLKLADSQVNHTLRVKPGTYTDDPDCIVLVQVILRAVAVRRWWYTNQKRLYLGGILRKCKAWAPRLFRQRGGVRDVIERAISLGMPIEWSDRGDGTERLYVIGLIKPVLKRLHPQLRVWGRDR